MILKLKFLFLFLAVVSLSSCVSTPPRKPREPMPPNPPPTSAPSAGMRGEMRGIWLSDPRGQHWEQMMRELRASGFNALFVNFATAGAAFYPSRIVPQISSRDEMALCIAAGRKYGIAVHAKIICNFAYLSPSDYQKTLVDAGRVMRAPNGKIHRQAGYVWIDPTQEANRRLVLALTREILERYDVAGLQLDYIRFPEMAQVSRAAQTEVITTLVAAIRTEARRIRPTIPMSAAVIYDLQRARHEKGQDWSTWAQKRLVDFLCPMNYTIDNERFTEWVRAQQREVRGIVPLYPGIGAYMFAERGLPASALEAQIALSQRLEPAGFVAFAYTEEIGRTMLSKIRLSEGK